MKVLILFVVIVLLISCITTQSTKYGLYNESNSNNNFSSLDSIYIDSDYVAVGKPSLKFQYYSDNEPFPIVRYPCEYPKLAIDNRIEGIVMLQIEIFTDGTVGRVVVKQSLMPGPGGFDEAAVNSVKKWKFSPAKYKGKPVACWTTIPITFSFK